MKAQTHLRTSVYVLALLGLLSVTLTEYFSRIWPVAAVALVIVAWFFEGPQNYRDAYRRIWAALVVCMLLFFPFDIGLSASLLLSAIHLSMFAQAYFLLNPKTMWAHRRILFVSFMQLLASTNLTTGIMFAVILALYCVVAIYAAALMYLQWGQEASREVSAVPLKSQNVPQGLLVSSIVWALILFPLTLGFFYSAPRLRYALIARGNPIDSFDLMQRARQRTGLTKTVQLGSFGRVQEDMTLVLRVEMSPDSPAIRKPLKWRAGALNIYDGVSWSSSRDYFQYYNGKQWDVKDKNAGMVYPRKNNLFITDGQIAKYETEEQLNADPRLLKQVCYLEIPYSDGIFGAGEIKGIQGPFTFGIGRDFNGSLYIANRQALPELISYTVYSVIGEPTEAQLRGVPQEKFKELTDNERSGDYVKTHYLQLPTSLKPRIKELALQITKDADTSYDKVNAIKKYLETQYVYSLDLARPMTDDPLYDFLFTSRTGHCEYFATAMTIMTRTIGIPARLARGFQKGEWNDTGQFYEVRQRDAHAWVEVYFPGYGWVPFDPSPRADADRYFENQRSALSRMLEKRMLRLQILWRKYIVGYNEVKRLHMFEEIRNFLFLSVPGALAGLFIMLKNTVPNLTSLQWLAAVLIAGLLVAAGFRLGKYVPITPLSWPWKWPKRTRRNVAFYGRMLSLLEKRKIVKPDCLTPREFLDVPPLREHPLHTDIETLTAIYYRVRFGGETLKQEETVTIDNILKLLKQSNGRVHNHEPAERR